MVRSEKELISKLDVVERQLKEAILLFFEKRDVVTIHTIAASVHQILFDLSSKNGVKSTLKNRENIPSSDFWEYVKKINYPYNFFKHADKDPKGIINVALLKRFSADFILDAILMYQNLKGDLFFEGKVFWAWFVSNFDEEFSDVPKGGAIDSLKELKLGEKKFEWILSLLHARQSGKL